MGGYIVSFSLFIGILSMIFEYWIILLLLALLIKLIAWPLKFVYRKLFGIIEYI